MLKNKKILDLNQISHVSINIIHKDYKAYNHQLEYVKATVYEGYPVHFVGYTLNFEP